MCGIIATVGTESARNQLLTGLENLEYRGYDSVGVAILNEGDVSVYKQEGSISGLKEKVRNEVPEGEIGIGHTRWSTHGPPTDENAHPHLDCTGTVAVAHNGIIDNYAELKTELQEQGHVFESDTDTEVIPHLVETFLARGASPEEAFRSAIDRLSGSFAVTMVISGEDTVYATRQDSPLVLGVTGGTYYLASDVPAFLEYTDNVVYLEDGDVAVVRTNGYEITDIDGNVQDRTIETVSWVAEDVERGQYDHYMIKEINEQPSSLARTIRGRTNPAENEINLEDFPEGSFYGVSTVHLVGCGTSYHAAMYGRLLLEERGIQAHAYRAGEYTKEPELMDDDTLVIGVTQSGETADTLSAIRRANEVGGRTLALTNVVGSTAARECDEMLNIRAGPEIGVAATKTFSSQVATLVLLAERIGRDNGYDSDATELLESLSQLPDHVDRIIDRTHAQQVAERFVDSESYFFIGRNISHPVALEGALKIKEISYKHAEGFSASELKHGPLALVTPQTPVLAVLTGMDDEQTIHNVEEVRSRGAPVIVVTNEITRDVQRIADAVLEVPEAHPEVTGILANVQLQLVSYHTADLLGRPIDKPRNLAKSVTVE